MDSKETLDRSEVLYKLNISEDILSEYEKILGSSSIEGKSEKEEFTPEDLKYIELLDRYKKAGLSYNEINLLSSVSGILKKLDIQQSEELEKIQKLSPLERLKENLEKSREEINFFKGKLLELEDNFKKEIEDLQKQYKEKEHELKRELENKEGIILNIDSKLKESLLEKSELESRSASLKAQLDAKQRTLEDIEHDFIRVTNENEIKQKALTALDERFSLALSDKSKLEAEIMPAKAQLEAKQKAFESLDRQLANLLIQKSTLESELASNRIEVDVSNNTIEDLKEYTAKLKAELEIKQKAVDNLNKDLSESIVQKSQLEIQLQAYKEGKIAPIEIKGKRSRELYQLLVQKEVEVHELQRKVDELEQKLSLEKTFIDKLKEQLILMERVMEQGILEMENEVGNRYKEQIESLKAQVELLVDKKQKEWEKYYMSFGEQHKVELLTLQKKKEEEIQKLKEKIEQQTIELHGIRIKKNPLAGILHKKTKI